MAQRTTSESELQELTDRLLHPHVEAHEEAMEALAEVGDERVVPHLVDVATLDAVVNNWERFAHPEVLRGRPIPYTLNHPEVRWPGVIDALCSIAKPNFDSDLAWLQWETWYTERDIEPLSNYREWKIQFYRVYHPLLGNVLDVEPQMDQETFEHLRTTNPDPSTLHPLNSGTFRPATSSEYVEDDEVVFGFELEERSYAVPMWMIFPHEGLNVELEGIPVSLSYCPLCDAPLLFDRIVDGNRLTLGCSGLILHGNKVMYDAETGSLWAQQVGLPIAGEALKNDWTLTNRTVSRMQWGEWKDRHTDTWLLDRETGYDWDYEQYRDYDGFMKRYWERDDLRLPGLEPNTTDLSDTDNVFVVESSNGDHVDVYPVSDVLQQEPIVDEVDGQRIVVVTEGEGAAAYEAPPGSVSREDDELIDGEGQRWQIGIDALSAGNDTLARIEGMESLWWAFRPKYDSYRIVGSGEAGIDGSQ